MNKVYMTSISKNMCIDKLDDTINKCNNAYHRIIKVSPVEINPSIYINFNKENNKEAPKFKVGNCVIILNNKNNITKGYIPK